MKSGLLVVALSAAFFLVVSDARALKSEPIKGEALSTLGEIMSRGYLKCGTSPNLIGFARPDAEGVHQGFDADLCKAIAAAIFKDPSKVEFTGLTSSERFDALKNGLVDLLSRTTTWTAQRDINLGLTFGGINYYDGQAFMVRDGIGSIQELKATNGATCIAVEGTTSLENSMRIFEGTGVTVVASPDETTSMEILAARTADCYTSDSSALAASIAAMPEEERGYWTILPELYSKEPLGPVTREGDDQFSDLVRWTLNTMIAAEEQGITMENVEEMGSMLGGEQVAEFLGVDPDWAIQIIKAVGNYGESFARHLYPIGLQRGINALYRDGGLQYALP